MIEQTIANDKSLHESNRYEDLQFPVGLYEVTKYKIVPEGRGFRDLHWHEELQYTMVTQGNIRIQVNGHHYNLNKGQAILINKNLLHITEEISEDGQYFSVDFPDKLLGFYSGSRMELDQVRIYTNNYLFPTLMFDLNSDDDWSRELAEKILELRTLLTDKPKFFQYRVSDILTSMWYRIIVRVGEIDTPRASYIRRQERMQKMISYIHENYMDVVLLEDVAAAGGVSVGECSRCFRTFIDESPNQYLMNYRIARAVEELNSTDKSITEIGFDCGFNDASHFIYYFKKKMGVTPQKYRS